MTNYNGNGISNPIGIAVGPDGALWFTNYGNDSIGRITTTGTVTNYTGPGINQPTGSPPAPTVRCGSPTTATTRSGGSPTAGTVTELHRPGHQRPERDHGRPRRRVVVHQRRATTRSGGSPPPGTVTNYTGTGHQRSRTGSPPAPTGRCGSPTTATTRSGGSPPPGRVTNYTGTGISDPYGDHGRARRGAVVHQLRQQLDRADHHRRDGHQLHRAPASTARSGSRPAPTGRCGSPTSGNNSIGRITTAGTVTNYTGTGINDPTGSRPGPTGRCGSPTTATTRSGGSPPPGWSPTTPARASTALTDRHGRPRRGAVVHQLRQQLDRADHHRRDGHQLHQARHQRSRRHRRRARRGAVVHQHRQQLDRADHHRRDGHQLHRHRHRRAGRDHGRARRSAVVHQPRQQLDRADHHRRGGHQLHRDRHQRARTGSRPGPTGRCGSPTTATTRSGGSPPPGWSPTTPAPASARPRDHGRPRRGAVVHQHGNNSIGRITTTGTVTNYTGTGINDPHGIAAGPDGALWFTNDGQQLDRADHHRRGGHQLHRPRHRQPAGITAGPDGALWFTNTATTRSGGSPPRE